MKGVSAHPALSAQSRGHSLNELCYEAADGDPYLALWLAVCYFDLFERSLKSRRRRSSAACDEMVEA